ncbi:hypothetical protein HOY82DRAFT_136676 [Tuber indicum]|nr:hypothetical protein HOY82DRAFT_136676 [Tuber indicum]
MASTFEIPTITPQDLNNFHKAHLSSDLHEHFTHTFLQPQPQASEGQPEHEPEHPPEDYLEEEDDLGYYPDGTKRTLTSAQVAMFRFSEVQSLLSGLPSPLLATSFADTV